MNTRTTIAVIMIAVIMATAPAAQAETPCELLLRADLDGNGIVTTYDGLRELLAGNEWGKILIFMTLPSGSINGLIPGCYQEPFTVDFSDSQPGTYLHEEEMGIHVALPATVELTGHLPENYNYVDYTFEILTDDPEGDPIMFFAIRASPDELYCQWVDFGAGCGQTTPPGVVVNECAGTVEIYSPAG